MLPVGLAIYSVQMMGRLKTAERINPALHYFRRIIVMKCDDIGVLQLKALHLTQFASLHQSPFHTPLVKGCDGCALLIHSHSSFSRKRSRRLVR